MEWFSEHREALVVAISGLVALLLTTKWGRARGAALRAVARALRGLSVTGDAVSATGMEMRIAEEIGGEKLSAQRAFEAADNEVNPSVKTESRAKKFGKFIGRALLGLVLRRVR